MEFKKNLTKDDLTHTIFVIDTTAEDGGVEELLCHLNELTVNDGDFNGSNGKEFLQPETVKAKFDSDAEYICNKIVSENMTLNDALSTFVDYFFTDYYEVASVQTLDNNNNLIVSIFYEVRH